MLLLMLASIAQRVLNLYRPTWTWLIPVMRFFINAASVPILYSLMFKSQILVVVADGVPMCAALSTNRGQHQRHAPLGHLWSVAVGLCRRQRHYLRVVLRAAPATANSSLERPVT